MKKKKKIVQVPIYCSCGSDKGNHHSKSGKTICIICGRLNYSNKG